MSGCGTHRLCEPVRNHFGCWSLTGGVAPVPCRSFSVGRNPPRGGAAAMGTNRKTDLADCLECRAAGNLLLDKADLTIIVQRSWVDRNDRCAGHHLPDVQGRQRRVQHAEPQLLLPGNTITEIKYFTELVSARSGIQSAVQTTDLSRALRTPAQRHYRHSRHMKSQCRVSPFPPARKNMLRVINTEKKAPM
jgi:hypothetical protein